MRLLRARYAAPLLMVGVLAWTGCSGDKSTNPAPGASLELNSRDLVPAAQYPHRFFTANLFPYHCSIHPSMTGTITVADAAPAGDTLATVTIGPGMAFNPAAVTIHTGGKVTWVNNDGTTHTVTSN